MILPKNDGREDPARLVNAHEQESKHSIVDYLLAGVTAGLHPLVNAGLRHRCLAPNAGGSDAQCTKEG